MTSPVSTCMRNSAIPKRPLASATLSSQSDDTNGEAMTTVHFPWGTDMQATVLNVRERLDNARSRLPERADRPS